MKYGHKQEESRWYEYGQGKEFPTKERAMVKLESYKTKVLTSFFVDGLYKLYDGNYIEETKNAIRVVFKYRYIESIL